MRPPLFDIICVTYDNLGQVVSLINSIDKYTDFRDFRIVLVNNGKTYFRDYFKEGERLLFIQNEKNIGWVGGIQVGLDNSKSPFVVFCNDDNFVPKSSSQWLGKFYKSFMLDDTVAAIGPSSNCVMGPQQIFNFLELEDDIIETNYLIGFFVSLRREHLDKAGGVWDGFRGGGDDLDLSIRLHNEGYKLLLRRDVYIHHHGFQTGEKLYGNPSVNLGWNSKGMIETVNNLLIQRHGFRKFFDGIQGTYKSYKEPAWKLKKPMNLSTPLPEAIQVTSENIETLVS